MQPFFRFGKEPAIGFFQIIPEILPRNLVVFIKNTPAHDVEKHIGIMPGIQQSVRAQL